MLFDRHTEKLTSEIHKLVKGYESGSYAAVRACLEACFAADSEIAVPAYVDPDNQNENASPVLYQKDGGFWYYIAYTAQKYVDEADADFAVAVPFVNFLALVGSNRDNAAIAGIVFNPEDDGGIIISLNEVDRLFTPVVGLMQDGAPGPLLQ